MIEENIGEFQGEITGKIYTVLKRTQEVPHTPLATGVTENYRGEQDFITKCNKDLNPLDDEFNTFELVETREVIKRIST